jgi:DNA-binding MarR family transcriptional regulator
VRNTADGVSKLAAKPGIEGDPLFAMGRIVREYDYRLAAVLREYDLSLIGWRLLLRLNERDGDNTTTLALRTLHERSAVVRAVDRLERASLAQRSNHHADRRNSIVYITDAGRSVLRRAAPSVQHVREVAYAGLTNAGLRIVADLLAHMGRNLNVELRMGELREVASSIR